jgi:NAD dependent epimerase/dehydratase family enzyme
MTIAITGATGALGRLVINQLKDHRVTMSTRRRRCER